LSHLSDLTRDHCLAYRLQCHSPDFSNCLNTNSGNYLFPTGLVCLLHQIHKKQPSCRGRTSGGPRILASRLIHASPFQTAEGRAKLLGFLTHSLDVCLSPYVPTTTPWLYPYPPNSTSETPAWRNSLWELGFAATWTWNSTVSQREAVVQLQSNLRLWQRRSHQGVGVIWMKIVLGLRSGRRSGREVRVMRDCCGLRRGMIRMAFWGVGNVWGLRRGVE
jgi:hypothetical protein